MNSNLPTNTIPFIWFFLKKYKLLFSLAFLTTTMWVLGSTLSAYYAKELIDTFPATKGLELKEAFILCIPPLIGLIITELLGFGHSLGAYIEAKLLPALNADIKKECYKYVSFHSSKFFSENFSGVISGKINSLGKQVEKLLSIIRCRIYQESACFIIMMTVVFFISPLFSLAFIIWFFITFTILIKIGKNCEKKSTKYTKDSLRSNGELVDNINNNFILKAFNKENLSLKFFKVFLDKEKKSYSDLLKSTTLLDFTLRNCVFIISNSIRVSFIIGYIKGWLTIGEITLLIAYRGKLNSIVWRLSGTLTPLFTSTGNIKESISIITQNHDIIDHPSAKPLKINKPTITIKNLSFSYEELNQHGEKKQTKIFKNLNLNIKEKEKVGIVGISGAGKSSLAHLLLRFYDYQTGSIKIDNQEIKNVTLKSLRNAITFIPQEASLLHKSLIDNIKIGNEKATKEDIEQAAKLANAHDFILKTSNQYNTVVGEKGIKLSGGQRQRIAIARAFLRQSPILLLDEATSALDSESENLIQQSLKSLMKNKTTVIIAHRLSTLKQMDRIIVLDKGEIIEEGSHKELIKKNGIYAKLWGLQINSYA